VSVPIRTEPTGRLFTFVRLFSSASPSLCELPAELEQANDTNEDSSVHRMSDLRRGCAGRSRHNLNFAEVAADAITDFHQYALVAHALGKTRRASTEP
jgi:hypothetical protein